MTNQHHAHLDISQAMRDHHGDLLLYTDASGFNRRFAVGKMKSQDRQLLLLKGRRLACHCIGGISMDDPDLKKLVRKGYMKFERVQYSTGWGGNYALNRTVAAITPAGEALLIKKGHADET